MEPCGSSNSSLSLRNLEDDYVVKNIDKVYPILIRHFSQSTDDSAIVLALRIAFGPGLDLFALDELDDKLLKHACPAAGKVLTRNLEECESCEERNKRDTSEIFCRCEEIISLLTKAMECIAGKDSTIELMKIRSLLLCSSELLYKCYSQCEKTKHFSGSYLDYVSRNLTSFFAKAQDLQENILRLVSTIKISPFAMSVLNDILTFLYKSGMVLLNLDVKTMADLWKGYICILDKYYEYLKNYHEISVPLECLSSNLTKKIEKFITEDTDDSQIIDKTGKILCFILKVIIKIAEKFSGHLRNCQNSLLNLLVHLNKFNHFNLGMDSSQHKKVERLRQLVTGVDPLLKCLISDKDFVQQFSSISQNMEMNSSQNYPFLLISCLIVKKLALASQNIRTLWFSSDENILRWIFQFLEKCNFELCLDLKYPCVHVPGKGKIVTDCYGYLLMNVSAFLLLSTSKEFALAERVLMKYILQKNPWCSLLAADVWCILARLAGSKLCYNQLNSLIKIFNNFGICSELPQKFFLESLIRRLFLLLSKKHKTLIIENHSRERNGYVWPVLSRGTSSENLKIGNSSVNDLTLCTINKFLNNGNFNVKDFEEMESLLLALDVESMNEDKEIEEKVTKLWKFDCDKLIPNPLSNRYLYSLCSATECIIPFMSSSNIYQVLCKIKSSLSNFSPVLRLHSLDIVFNLAKSEESLNEEAVCKLISSLFYEFLTNQNVFIRIRSMNLFSNFAYSTCQTQIITKSINNDSELQIRLKNYLQRENPSVSKDFKFENYLDKLENSAYEHFCKKDCNLNLSPMECLEPPHKKIILDKKIGENSELEQMISTLKKEVARIRKQANNLSVGQRKEISLIIDMLREIFE